jgi:predicted tellurium resistance membrane protein TerC
VVTFIDEIETALLYLKVIESILSSDSLLVTLIMSFACDELVLLLGFFLAELLRVLLTLCMLSLMWFAYS